MSEQPTYAQRILTKAIALANKRGGQPGFNSSEVGPIVRRAELGPFVIQIAANADPSTKASRVDISHDGENVFWAVFQSGWQDDPNEKLLHWGPGQEWREEFMALEE